MKMVILDGNVINPDDLSWGQLEEFGALEVYENIPETEAEAVRRIGDATVIFTHKTPITNSLLEACPQVKYIGILSTGYDIVDLDAMRAHGVTITTVPSYGTPAVAQFVFALLLEICLHVADHSASVLEGNWIASKVFCYWNSPLIELHGKTLGIIGYGAIGQEVAKIANAFGMNVIAYNHRPKVVENNPATMVSLEELFAQADMITLHCPLTEDTKGLINKDSIAKMKDGVILINTARGGLIVEEDLVEALNSGKMYGAGLDVVSKEPMEATNPLMNAKNIIITPHIAWAPKEARQRLVDIVVDNLRQFLNGTPTNNLK